VPLECRGGLRFGALAGLFYAVQQVSSTARAEKGLQDTVIAGTATGAVFGATGMLMVGAILLPFPFNAKQVAHVDSKCGLCRR